MTIEELEEIVNKYNEDDDTDILWDVLKYDEESETINGLEFNRVESYGGEGQGDDLWIVFSVGDQYFRKSGWWVSFDGPHWDGALEEVEPKEVTVTKWVPLTDSPRT